MKEINLENLLIVEDNEQNINDAVAQLGDVRIARTLSEFDSEFEKNKPEAVLSDLYFPTGYEEKENGLVRNELTKILNEYISKYREPNYLGQAVEQICKALGLKSLDEFFEYPAFKNDSVVAMPDIRWQIKEAHEKNEETKKYKALLEKIQNGTYQLPSGVFVYRKCKGKSVLCVIVTSAYHHGIEFQPFVSHVGRYFDNLKDGKKQWKKAFDALGEEC